MSPIGPLGNWDIAQIVPVQIADKSLGNGGHIVVTERGQGSPERQSGRVFL